MLPHQVITAILTALITQGITVSALPQGEPSNSTRSGSLNGENSNQARGLQTPRSDLDQSQNEQGHDTYKGRALVARATASEIFGYVGGTVTILTTAGTLIRYGLKKRQRGFRQATDLEWQELTAHVARVYREDQEAVARILLRGDIGVDDRASDSGSGHTQFHDAQEHQNNNNNPPQSGSPRGGSPRSGPQRGPASGSGQHGGPKRISGSAPGQRVGAQRGSGSGSGQRGSRHN